MNFAGSALFGTRAVLPLLAAAHSPLLAAPDPSLSLSLVLAPPASLNVAGGISAAAPNRHVGKLAPAENFFMSFLHAADSFLLWISCAFRSTLEIGMRSR